MASRTSLRDLDAKLSQALDKGPSRDKKKKRTKRPAKQKKVGVRRREALSRARQSALTTATRKDIGHIISVDYDNDLVEARQDATQIARRSGWRTSQVNAYLDEQEGRYSSFAPGSRDIARSVSRHGQGPGRGSSQHGKLRTPAQRAATKRLVALNKSRAKTPSTKRPRARRDDNLTKRHSAGERGRINIREPWERRYWSKKFRVSESKLRSLVARYGTNAEDVGQAVLFMPRSPKLKSTKRSSARDIKRPRKKKRTSKQLINNYSRRIHRAESKNRMGKADRLRGELHTGLGRRRTLTKKAKRRAAKSSSYRDVMWSRGYGN